MYLGAIQLLVPWLARVLVSDQTGSVFDSLATISVCSRFQSGTGFAQLWGYGQIFGFLHCSDLDFILGTNTLKINFQLVN